MNITKKINEYWFFQLTGYGKLLSFQLFKWKQGFNVQLLGLSFSLYFNRGKYQRHHKKHKTLEGVN